ncbi:MAG: bifunctional riboflavin kinase/FAD synthetase [Bacillota bacterium]
MEKKAVVGLGFFDGMHIGHMQLIKRVKEYGDQHEMPTLVYTFDEHPKNVIQNAQFSKLLTSNAQKKSIILCSGISQVIFDRFDEALANVPPSEFVKEVIVNRLNAGHLVVGFNYTFGSKGQGDIALLRSLGTEFGFTVEVVPAVYFEGELVSSTLIRKNLENGDMRRVAKLIGRPFDLEGTVSFGRQLGSKMNFPTANIYPDENLITPLKGVYATFVKVDGEDSSPERRFRAVTNVGTNPTVSSEESVRVETHIFDFSGDIYNRRIAVQFIELIRTEQKFSDIETLFAQISKDSLKAREILDGEK